MRYLTLFVLINVLSATLSAQNRKFYSTDNGLSNSLINQILQDKKGFIWVATEYGLNKFDGVRFSVYKHIDGDSASLKENYVRSLCEDSYGNFFVGTIAGLMKYNRATDSFTELTLTREGKTVYPHIISIVETHSGEIWLATSGQGVFRAAKGSDDFVCDEQLTAALKSVFLNIIYEDSKHNLWIATHEGVNLYNPLTGQMTSFKAPDISSNNISAIEEDMYGDIYVGTLTQGLNKYDARTGSFALIPYTGKIQPYITALFQDNRNRFFIGTDGQGLMIYNREKNVIEDYDLGSTSPDISKGKIHNILQDKDQNLWLSIFQKGLMCIPMTESNFEYYGHRSPANNLIGSNLVTAIYRCSKGVLWIGTDNDGLYGIDQEAGLTMHYFRTKSHHSAPDIIHSIYEDAEGYLWLGSYGNGLAKLNPATGLCEYISPFNDAKIYSITEDKYKRILVATHGSGFYLLDNAGTIMAHYESSKRETDVLSVDELANDWINCLMCDRDGLVWIGHYKGLSCFDPVAKTFLTYAGQNNLLPGKVAQALAEDKEGHIWAGTTTGLYRFDKQTQTMECRTTADGLSNDVICGICEDESRNLWISTYRGISKFITTENRFVNYYETDGLQGNEFSRGASLKDSNGKIYFGGVNGLTAFYARDIIEAPKELDVSLTNFYLFNRPVKKGDRSGNIEIVNSPVMDAEIFRLDHFDNTFSMELSTFDFLTPERISYAYRMEGLHQDWMSTAMGVNRITYNNLPHGQYAFEVKACDNNNFSPVKTINIHIAPPWHKTWWAYTLYTLALLLLAWGVAGYIISRVRYKRQLLEKKHAEEISKAKLQFFTNISHEIKTPMTLIINPLEKLISENPSDEKHSIYLMIYRNAQRILRLINQLMDVHKLDEGKMKLSYRETDVVNFISDVMLTFEYLAKRKNIDFRFEHEAPRLNVWIDLNNFDKVLMNLFSNAFKYTPDNGAITVTLSSGESFFEISVEDTGIGVDKSEMENIFNRFFRIENEQTHSYSGTGIGLHLSRSLVELHHGALFVENREGGGSRFIVRMPLGKKHIRPEEMEHPELLYQYKISPNPADAFDAYPAETNPKPAKRAGTRYRILVVDDEDNIRQYLKYELSAEYKVADARNGKEALEYILREKPDLVVSDVMMPKMDGITLSNKIKGNINVNHIPVILLTGKTDAEDFLKGLETGADIYLEKPFNIDVLKQAVSNLISNRERLKNKFSGNQMQEDKIDKIELKSSDDLLMERVMHLINENIANPDFSVEDLAAGIGMSRVHLHRKLKELTNQSARNFIRGVRLRQAAILLTSKKFSISDVVYATGFLSLSHFSQSFHDFFGVSPTEYISNETK